MLTPLFVLDGKRYPRGTKPNNDPTVYEGWSRGLVGVDSGDKVRMVSGARPGVDSGRRARAESTRWGQDRVELERRAQVEWVGRARTEPGGQPGRGEAGCRKYTSQGFSVCAGRGHSKPPICAATCNLLHFLTLFFFQIIARVGRTWPRP